MIHPDILIALLSAALFGASTPFAKLLLGSVDPWMMAGLLYLGAGLGLGAVHLCRAALRLSDVEAPLRRAASRPAAIETGQSRIFAHV
jgi:drug/metabolite transporter (DMT)-like permease